MDQPSSISLTRQQDFIGTREIREFFMRDSRRYRGGKEGKEQKKKQKQSNYQKVETEREEERRKERVENKREGYVITKRRPNQIRQTEKKIEKKKENAILRRHERKRQRDR